MTIENKPTVEILRTLFLQGLDLPEDYGKQDGKVIPSVFIRDRRVAYGHTPLLQIELQSIGSKIFHNSSYIDKEGKENRDVGIQELIQVVMTSEDRSAEERKHELISLLDSQLSQRLQAQWNVKFAVIPTGVNTFSTPTGPYAIFRVVILINAISMKTYISEYPTYDTIEYNPNVDEIDTTNIITINLTQERG